MWTGEPKLGFVALGAWVFPATLRGCAKPVELVERRGQIAGIQARNILAPELGVSIVVLTNDGDLDFGEIWLRKGFAYELASAALCEVSPQGQ